MTGIEFQVPGDPTERYDFPAVAEVLQCDGQPIWDHSPSESTRDHLFSKPETGDAGRVPRLCGNRPA